ncbi:glycosyltransferase family 4 protein [Aurantiacibacter rhizosphaerae]|uniref:Glycosyltransferase n=1 Tax=Aurantiacibacter rhizosphaerae TaxID=2691582 RepID=A0A844X988_9SPHN|nr:glycosyltransferase family 4 protein [Aurantiacibacter rhizosphaerae]MWV26961.1 glycosyltransferase [Aurantiacibacter rhizosphaerae]
MKLLFVNRFFHPDQSATSVMLSDLLSELNTTRRECVVITGSGVHTEGGDLEQRNFENVSIIRVPSLKNGNPSMAGRLLNFLLFYLGIIVVGLWRFERGDCVVCLTDPPLISVPVSIVARLKGAKVVNWLQDIYPETATILGFGSDDKLAIRLMRKLRDRSLKDASVNVCIGAAMKQRVRSLGVSEHQIRVIPNWTDEDGLAPMPISANPLRKEWDLSEESLIVGYSGNLGRAHDVDTMVDAGRRLIATGHTNLEFLFVGGGAKLALLPSVAEEPEIAPHFKIRGYRPRSELRLSLAVADIHWLSLEPELEGLIVPSKFYGAIAAGRPMIFIGETKGEVAGLIREADCGESFCKGDVQGVADYLARLASDCELRDALGRNARAFCEQELRRSGRISAWDELLTEMVA